MNKVKIWGWTADNSGCQAYRVRFPFDAIREAFGNQVTLGYGTTIPPVPKETADIVIGQRVCMEGPSRLWQRWAKEGQKKLVLEIDDDLWNIEPSNARAYYFFKGKVLERLEANIRAAHVVTVSTAELAEMVHTKTGHQNIHVVPNAVPAWLLDHKAERNHAVGWGGSPTHHGDFDRLRHGMKKFLQHNKDKTFHCIGMNYAQWMKLPEAQCHFTPWLNSVEDFFRSIDYSVGVVPLADNVFNRSKSDIKFLELAALGIPTIASDVPAYHSIEDGWTGFLVSNDHEWSRMIKGVVDSPEVFTQIGENARRYVAECRTTAHTAPMWMNALMS